jgi:hypothetical protein
MIRFQARIVALIAALLGSLLLLSCSHMLPGRVVKGQSEADVRAAVGEPSARHALPEGGTRLEYATGPMGRETWMFDLDAQGRVIGIEQVLTDATFLALQPGISREELLRTFGRPGERRSGGRQGGEVWSYRYPTNDCLWFQVSLDDDGRVMNGTYGNDPRCEMRVR